MMTPRLELMLEIQGFHEAYWTSPIHYQSATLDQVVAFVAGQVWVAPRWWVSSGVGMGLVALSHDECNGVTCPTTYDAGPSIGFATTVAVGKELLSEPKRMHIDLHVRAAYVTYGSGSYTVSGTLGVGIAWLPRAR